MTGEDHDEAYDAETGEEFHIPKRHHIACAGRMIMSWNACGGLGKVDALAAWLGIFDPNNLDTGAPVFDGWDEMADAQELHEWDDPDPESESDR